MKPLRVITQSEISGALGDKSWDLGNEVLYDLCRKQPHHKSADVIIAKILLIGRVYAAALERRKGGTDFGDRFYIDTVVPKVQASQIDAWIVGLPATVSAENSDAVVSIHYEVMRLFHSISGLEKRSLASKYLHFHRPDLFFIYDTRAIEGIRLTTPRRDPLKTRTKFDPSYEFFFRRCLWLRNDLEQRYGKALKPRELDKVLLYLTYK